MTTSQRYPTVWGVCSGRLAEGDRIVVSATQAFYRRLKGLIEAS